jgi:4-amino-4-deoxy-L-arabinose transferase-like glycosyltransferase
MLNKHLDKGPLLGVALVCAVLAVCFMPFEPQADAGVVQGFMLAGLLAAAGAGLFLRGNTERLAALLMVCGLILRVGYIWYTLYWSRQHDIGVWEGAWVRGHGFYIDYYVEHWLPPGELFWQSHHPPLFHFLAGKLLALLQALGKGYHESYESLQLAGAAVSGLIMLVSYRVFRQLGLKDAPLLLATALVAFHPTLIILAGSVNNDNLMVLFVLWAFSLTLRWRGEQSMKTTVLLALAIGLGMLTKLSAALVSLVTAAVFIERLARREGRAAVIRRLGVFFAICVPLGVWYSVYLSVRFGLPPGYIQAPGASIYIGNYSLAHRFLYIPAEQWGFLPYCQINTAVDNNVLMYIIKCSLFGEFRYTGGGFAPLPLVFVNTALIALSLAAMVWCAVKRRGGLLLALWLAHMAGYVGFNITMPYICTMDARYLVPAIVCGAGFLGLAAPEKGAGRWLSRGVYALAGVFCVLVCVFFLKIDG